MNSVKNDRVEIFQDQSAGAAIVAAAGVTDVVAFAYRLHIGAGLAALEGLRLALSVLSSHVCPPFLETLTEQSEGLHAFRGQ